jgi:hypothetical protein
MTRRDRGLDAAVWPLALVVLPLVLLAATSGCTRKYFRLDADHEVSMVLDEKDNFAEWELRDYNVYPDPRARYFDPANPDRPPMPPDDPAAWLLAPHPQKPHEIVRFEGTGYLGIIERWDAQNRARMNEKKQQRLATAVSTIGLGQPASGQSRGGLNLVKLSDPETGAGVRTAEFIKDGDELPVLSSPRKEMASLVVPTPKQVNSKQPEELLQPPRELPNGIDASPAHRTEPFIIDLEQALELAVLNSREFQNSRENLYLAALPVTLERFAFAPQYFATFDAVRTKAGSEVGGNSDWTLNSDVQLRKLFSTGALLVGQLANTTVVNLTGTGRHTVSQSNLIVDLSQPFLRGGGRAVTLEDLTQAERDLVYELRTFARFHREFFVSVAAGGGGLTGGGGGDFGGVELTVRGQASSVGYYATLQAQSALRNEEKNLQKLRTLLVQYRNLATDPLPVGGRAISPLDVDQVEQSQRQSESRLLQRNTAYADSLDQFKIQLGLPTDFNLELDDSLLQPIYEQLQAYENAIATARSVSKELAKLNAQSIAGPEVRASVRRIIGSEASFRPLLEEWDKARPQADQAKLLELREQQLRLQKEVDQLEQQDQPVPAALEASLNAAKRAVDLVALDLAVRAYEQEPWKREANPDVARKVRDEAFDRVVVAGINVISQLKKERLDRIARVESWPQLPPMMLEGMDLMALMRNGKMKGVLEAQNLVGQVALANRLDLMNQRARVVDSWRNLAVFANSLLGVFDVRYHMDVSTPAGLAQPLDFEGKRGRHQLFVNTELPLTRKLERNNYRSSLIAYQRQRRNLMATEDQTLFQVRQNLRELHRQSADYLIQQRAVDLAHRNFDSSLEVVEQGTGDPAAQTQRLLGNVNAIVQAENGIIQAWITYIRTRMRLYRDLELLRVDSRGVWIDEYSTPVSTPAVQPVP